MDLRLFRVVLEVGRAGSMAGAARQLRFSVSSVSSQVRQCEKTMGFRIFERTPDGVVVTPRGQDFMHLAATVIYLVDAFAAQCRSADRASDGAGVSTFPLPRVHVSRKRLVEPT